MKIIKIKYNGSVLTPAGFRGVNFEALAEKISEKRARVIEVLAIDGEEIKSNMSRTGAKRQRFWGVGAGERQVSKLKNLSSCEVIS